MKEVNQAIIDNLPVIILAATIIGASIAFRMNKQRRRNAFLQKFEEKLSSLKKKDKEPVEASVVAAHASGLISTKEEARFLDIIATK